jgi:hypothetical protein
VRTVASVEEYDAMASPAPSKARHDTFPSWPLNDFSFEAVNRSYTTMEEST